MKREPIPRAQPVTAVGPAEMKSDGIELRLRQVPEWSPQLSYRGISRSFRFPDFRSVVGFLDRLAPLCDRPDRHPAITIRGGQVTLELPTGEAELSDGDFDLAAGIDRLSS